MASKRGDNRRRQKRSQRHGQRSVVRFTQFGPVELVQQGTYFHTRVDPEHPDYEAYRAARWEEATHIPERILALREEIAELAAPYHAFDVIFAVWATYARVSPLTLRAVADDGLPTAPLYVAHVLLDRSDAGPVRDPVGAETRRGPNATDLGGRVIESVRLLPVWFTHRQKDADEELDPWLELRSRLYMHRLFFNSFTYAEQEIATIQGLFAPFASELLSTLGYGVDEALAINEAVASLPMLTIRDRLETAANGAQSLMQSVEARRARNTASSAYPDELLDQLAALPVKVARKRIESLAMSWAWHEYGQRAAFTVEELAAAAGVAMEPAQRFLGDFSVAFGQRPDRERWETDPHRAVGGEIESMKRHPIVHDGHGAFLPVAPQALFFGLRDRLTDALKSDAKAWQRFERHRARVLEERAVKALTQALDAAWAHRGVRYCLKDDDSGTTEGEIDGVLRSDGLLVLIEAKAGALAPSARRTAPDRLQRELRDLIQAAAVQLTRAQDVLTESRTARIETSSGGDLTLDLDGVTRLLRVVVTLEDLSAVAPAAWQLQDAGLLPAEDQAPWVVGIHELELICELVERPAQLIHYVLRRMRSHRQRVWAMDEMDFFMRYLQEGLFWTDQELDGASLQLGGHTGPLDAWWFGKHGAGKPARQPRQRMSQAERRLLDDIAATGAPARLEAQLMLLEMDQRFRERVAAGLSHTRRKTERDSAPHDMTLVFGADFAVTIVAVPPGGESDLQRLLRRLGTSRTERSQLRRWLGLGVVVGSTHRLDAMAVLLDTDRLAEEVPDRPNVDGEDADVHT